MRSTADACPAEGADDPATNSACVFSAAPVFLPTFIGAPAEKQELSALLN
jgi:hypothetical protein